jgi:hypothetical protein
MSDLEYFGQMNPKPLTSLEEDFKRDRAQFQKDELDRALRRSGKLVTPEPETTYERFEEG